MEDKQQSGVGASSSATSVEISPVEELQSPVAVNSGSVSDSTLEDPSSAQTLTSSLQEYWTAIDHTARNDVDFEFVRPRVREFPGLPTIRRFKEADIKYGKMIAEGGQGRVYEARLSTPNQASGGDIIVAKKFKKRYEGQWPEEIFGLDVLDLRICRFLGYCLEGDTFILLMKKYDNSLRVVLDKQMTMMKKLFGGSPLPDYTVVSLIIQIAIGMRFLHEHDISHRDLKADNIFVNLLDNGDPAVVYIGDFDVASSVVGTGLWRAPEVLQALRDGGRPFFTPQSDVYSFAMTCYEILTGGIPFKEANGLNIDLVLRGTRPELPSNLHVKVKDLMDRCWHQDPSMRPTFHEIVEEWRGLHSEIISGSEFASQSLDELFDFSTISIAGLDSQSLLLELKKLVNTLVEKYEQVNFLKLCFEVVEHVEQYQSQFGSRLLEQPPPLIPYPEWFASLVLQDSIDWKIQVFTSTSPDIPERAKLGVLLWQVKRVAFAVLLRPDKTGTMEETSAWSAESKVWSEERAKRILPENPHRACKEKLINGLGQDGLQACSLCKRTHDALTTAQESVRSCLYGESSTLRTILPSSYVLSLQEKSRTLL